MRDPQDRKMRELVYRLIDLAPEAPRFPEEPMVKVTPPVPAGPKRRFGPIPVAALTAVVVAGVAASIVVFRDASNPPANQATTTSTTIDPLAELQPLWPQTSLEEVRQAQELADAGDPRYRWQVDTFGSYQPAQNHPNDTEVFARFLEEVLGWEGFLWDEVFAHPDGLVPGDVVYIRCAPGLTNPLYPTDPVGAACAPTIDELRYETVKIHVAQFRESPGAIWVVTGWEMIEPFAQIAPPSDAEIALFLEPSSRHGSMAKAPRSSPTSASPTSPPSGSTRRYRSCTPRAPGPPTSERSSSSSMARCGPRGVGRSWR